jgi:D-alanyl-D-alanine carboxypeptidase (penicillin-binding protein 5/6)
VESSRATETQTLLNFGFRFYETVQLYQAGTELAKARVWKGMNEEVTLGLNRPLFVTIPRGRYEDLEAQVEINPQLSAPLEAGQVVGMINVRMDGELIAHRDLVTLAAVEEAGFFGSTWDGLRLWVNGLFEGEDEDEDESANEAARPNDE